MRSAMALLSLFPAGPALACGACRPLVMARVAAEPFWPTALMLALPILLLVGIAWAVHRSGGAR